MTFKNYNQPQFVPNVFTDEECDTIISLCEANELEVGTMYAGGQFLIMHDCRYAENWMLPENGDQTYEWIRQRMYEASRELNASWWEFDLESQRTDRLAFVRYPEGGYFRAHTDNTIAEGYPFKKLTCVLQLSAPDSYEGGDLWVAQYDEPCPRDRGTMIAFPTFARHMVDEVTSGSRMILVNWCHSDRHFR